MKYQPVAPHQIQSVEDERVEVDVRIQRAAEIPHCLWLLAKANAVAFGNNAGLLGGETELSLVA